MKFITIFLLAACLQVSAGANAQQVTLKGKNLPLEKILSQIRLQAGYDFVASAQLIKDAPKVDLDLNNVSVKEALDACFNGSALTYEIENKTIIIRKKINLPEQHPSTNIDIIRGRVTNEAGEPMAGATVTVKGTNNATSTNQDGWYELKDVPEKATLVISSVNSEPSEIKVNGRSLVHASVKIKVKELDAPIVVAYNTTTQRTNTGSVSIVKGDQVRDLPYRSVDKSLQGLVPGLQITGGTGAPGGGLSSMVIRGISTGSQPTNGSTVRSPLVVVDGVPISLEHFNTSIGTAVPVTNPLAQLNPSDIETITVLKDAAAIALYGSKASNGVILITTKRGKAGKTTFTFRHQTDIASQLKGKLDLLSQEEFMKLLFDTYKSTPRNPSPWTDALIRTDLISKFPTIVRAPGDTAFYPATDWFNELFDDNALTISNELAMSGGSERSNFYLNLAHLKQNGVVKKKGYERASIRFNFENRPATGLKIGLNSTFSYNIQDYDDQTEAATTFGVAYIDALNPARDINGNYFLNLRFPTTVANPAAALEYNINRHTSYRALNRLYAELNVAKHFTLASSLGADFMLVETKEKLDPRLQGTGSGFPPGTGRIFEKDSRRVNIITTNMLRYDRQFGDHALNALIAQEGQVFHNKSFSVEAKGNAASPPLPHYDQIGSPGYTVSATAANKDKQTMLSFFGQANYNFRKKYFLSASARTDGSSRFGEQNQWGSFWSTGAGWVLSEESFLQNTSNWLDYLKLRGSLGIAGSSAAVGALDRYDLIRYLGFLGSPAYQISAAGNPSIQWEKTFTWDAGLEATLFDNRISLTADFYSRRTKDLLYPTALPSTGGYASVLSNIGNMSNTGVELSLSIDIVRSKSFIWKLSGNWSSNRNRLVKANVPLQAISGNFLGNEEGRNFNSFYMPVWAGVNPGNGKPQWINQNGVPDTLFANAKKQFVGQPQPKGFGALTNNFTYRNFELSVFLYYQYGSKIYRGDNSVSDGNSPYRNVDRSVLDYWQKPGDMAANPRRRLSNTDGGQNVSTRFLFSGDYIRLRNVSLSYNFPRKMLDRLHISMMRVFIQGHNLAIITSFPGKDPDNMNLNGSVGQAYPNQRSFSAGINLNF